MPEIPELNILAKVIERKFKRQKVDKLEINWIKKLNAPKEEYEQAVVGSILLSVKRVGKELYLTFDNGVVLSIHLMIIGTINLLPLSKPVKYSIFDLWFENDEGIGVADSFGQAKLTLNPSPKQAPEVLTDDFTLEYFAELLKKGRTPIKTLLLDQNKLVGIGNATADEVLYACRISPVSSSKFIPEEKVRELFETIPLCLNSQESHILANKSVSDTFEMKDKGHRFVHNPVNTHTEDGEAIIKAKINGRLTYYTESQIKY